MIAIIDYGMGNLRSVQKAFESKGANAIVTSDIETIQSADKIVMPGVGAFDHAVDELKERGLFDKIIELIKSGKPYLGICLGFQLLFDTCEESLDNKKGFGIIPGEVKRFSDSVKVPHMGWNQIEIQKDCPFLRGIESGTYFYFVHSYYGVPNDKASICTTTKYDLSFTSSVYKNNIFATQFHPEKSQEFGLKIVENFIRG